MARHRKLVVAVIGALVFVSIAVWALRGEADVEYRTAPVDRGDVAYTVSATGTPNAVVNVQVGSQVSGNILALYADFNTKVRKGQIVARIDPQIFQARVDQARAALNSAQAAVVNAGAQIEKSRADVATAKANVADQQANVVKAQSAVNDAITKFNRRAAELKEGLLAQDDLDTAKATEDQAVAMLDAAKAQLAAARQGVVAAEAQVRVAETQLTSAEAQVKQSQAALESAQADLDHTYIPAPVDGIVVARHVDVGQTVAASLQAPTLFEIAEDLTKMQVDTNVSEADVGHVRVGMPATFTVDAYPGTVFKGVVTSIRKAPINIQNVVTYDVVISVANPDLKLFPGMSANVKILVDRHPNVLRMPNAALRYRPETLQDIGPALATDHKAAPNQQIVWVLNEKDAPRAVTINPGISDGVYTEVTGGAVKQGDRVIVASFSSKTADASPSSPGRRGGPRF